MDSLTLLTLLITVLILGFFLTLWHWHNAMKSYEDSKPPDSGVKDPENMIECYLEYTIAQNPPLALILEIPVGQRTRYRLIFTGNETAGEEIPEKVRASLEESSQVVEPDNQNMMHRLAALRAADGLFRTMGQRISKVSPGQIPQMSQEEALQMKFLLWMFQNDPERLNAVLLQSRAQASAPSADQHRPTGYMQAWYADMTTLDAMPRALPDRPRSQIFEAIDA